MEFAMPKKKAIQEQDFDDFLVDLFTNKLDAKKLSLDKSLMMTTAKKETSNLDLRLGTASMPMVGGTSAKNFSMGNVGGIEPYE